MEHKELKLNQLKKDTLNKVHSEVQAILQVSPENATFAKTFGLYDRTRMLLLEALHVIELVSLVSSVPERRNEAKALAVDLRQALRKDLDGPLSNHLVKCAEHLKKTLKKGSEEELLVDFVIADLYHQGGNLPPDKMIRLRELQFMICELSASFDKNVQDKTGPGMDYPTVNAVLEQSESISLRQSVYLNFNNRAYPDNYRVLTQLNQSRHEMAHLLGYRNYADFDLSNQMSGSPEKVREFLNELAPIAKKKAEEDRIHLISIASESEHTASGKLHPWSVPYLRSQYAKNKMGLDLHYIAEFFPLERTLEGLFWILKQQFGIIAHLKETLNLWDPEVKTAAISFDGQARGEIYLDLFPRQGKYTHGRVMIIRPSRVEDGKEVIPGEAAILTNFTRPALGRPALLTFDEVRTLFHEFGHAIHALLINTTYSFMDSGEMAVTYGLPVKTDFVELPSQFLEFWLKDPEIVQELSYHYRTGEKLKLQIARSLVNRQNGFRGIDLVKQLALSNLSLELFSKTPDEAQDEGTIHSLWDQVRREYMSFQELDQESHYPAAFLHLTSYGAKYYSYLWTRVFASDLFSAFRRAGLLKNQELGKRYCLEVLSKGGSVHPSQLLSSFLGRPVSSKPFLDDLTQILN